MFYDFTLENTSGQSQTVELLSPVDTATSASRQDRFTLPYVVNYTASSTFRILIGSQNFNITLNANTTLSGLISIFNEVTNGIWSIVVSNAVDGNVIDCVSVDGASEMEINLVTYSGTWSAVHLSVNVGDDVEIADLSTIYVAGLNTKLFKSIDGGNSFSELTMPNTSDGIQLSFLNANAGWAGYQYISLPTRTSYINRTINGGSAWNTLTINDFVLRGLAFIDASNGLLAGIDYSGPTTYCIRQSSDGGASFGANVYSTTNTLLAPGKIQYISSSIVYAFPANGLRLLKSIDGGATWVAKVLPGATNYQNGFFIDANNGFVVGSSGKVYYTDDGGDSWNNISIATGNSINSVYFINLLQGWVGRQGGQITKTIDGGANWTNTVVGGAVGVLGLKMIDQTLGFASSQGYGILKYS